MSYFYTPILRMNIGELNTKWRSKKETEKIEIHVKSCNDFAPIGVLGIWGYCQRNGIVSNSFEKYQILLETCFICHKASDKTQIIKEIENWAGKI